MPPASSVDAVWKFKISAACRLNAAALFERALAEPRRTRRSIERLASPQRRSQKLAGKRRSRANRPA